MPLYYISLKASEVKNDNTFTIQNSHRMDSSSFQLKSATVTTNPLPGILNATTQGRAPTNPIIGGNNTILLDFSSQNVIRERQIISNVSGGGLLPIPFNYTSDRTACQYNYLDNEVHFSDVPFTYNIRVFKSDGITPFKFDIGNPLVPIDTATNGSTLNQIDLVFSYIDHAEEPIC
jgi:hypothetical protein